MNWIEKLKVKWGLTSNLQFVIIMLVFACTGTTIVLLKRPIVNYFSGEAGPTTVFTVTYYILILPIYNIFLLAYGFVFGQFEFFWNYEKKMLSRFQRKKAE